MTIRSLLLCAPSVLLGCHHGSPPMDQDAPPDDGATDSPGDNPPDGNPPDGNPPDGDPLPTGTCTGLAAGLTCSTPYCSSDYSIIDLGMLGAGDGSSASAIDDDGNVAGTFRPAPASMPHAFRWSARDGFVDLGTLGGASSQGLGVSGGRVAGVSDLAGGGSHAFLSDEQGLHDLGTLGSQSLARSVNASGVAVGESRLPGGAVRATRFDQGMASDLGTLAGTPTATSAAFAINASGVIVGRSDTKSGRSHATLWTNGTVVDLDTTNTLSSIARAINANGEVVGERLSLGLPTPARFAGGAVLALGLPTGTNSGSATSINDAGVIVGNSKTVTAEATAPGPAFVYDGTSVIELARMLPFAMQPSYRITAANGINNAAQIAAEGNQSTFEPGRALVLMPHCTPAPPFRSLAFAAGTTVAAPAGAAAGDLLLAALRYDGDPAVVTAPSGWSPVADHLAGAGTAEAFHLLVYVHTATADEPAAYTFSVPDSGKLHVQVAAYPYLSTIDSMTVVSTVSVAIEPPDVTTTQDNSVLIGIFTRGGGGGMWTRALGMFGVMTERSDIDGMSLQDEFRPTAGVAGSRSSQTTSGTLAAILIALH